MRFIAFRQQHGGAQINGLSPELRKQLALDLDVLHVLGIARRKRRGNFVGQAEPDLISGERVQMEIAHVTKQVSRRLVELLPFPLVHVGPDGVSVRTLEAGINVEQRLDVIVAGRKLAHRFERIAQRKSVQRGCAPRRQALHVNGDHLCPRPPPANLQSRLRIIGPGDDHKQPSGNRWLLRLRQRDFEGGAGSGGGDREMTKQRMRAAIEDLVQRRARFMVSPEN